jgi:GNAT superfamily N-acetyltransferase
VEASAEPAVRVRPLVEEDLDSADRIMRVAFGTFRGLPDPSTAYGDAEYVRTRFRAAPDCAWVADVGGDVVGSVFAARWGSFGFFGPLTIHPQYWDRRVGSRLLEPVLEAFERWQVRQAGLFTFPMSPKHLGLYQKHGFWPRFLTVVMAKPVAADAGGPYTLFSRLPAAREAAALEEIRALTNSVFAGLDLEREILAAKAQGIGDTVLLRSKGELAGMAVCHRGAGSEAGSGACYAKFGAVRPGADAADRFEQLLEACEAFAAGSGLARLVAGVNTGRLDAYRRMLGRGFRADQIGISMHLLPESPDFDTPDHYVIDDLR